MFWILSSVAVFLLAAFALPGSKKFTLRRSLPFASGDVWQRVFDVAGQVAWRSDIVEVQLLQAGNPRTWRERLRLVGEITLRDAQVRPQQYWGIVSVDHPLFETRWSGEFIRVDSHRTEIVLTEEFHAKNWRGKLALFFLIRLEALMQTYAGDLERALGKR